MRNLEENAGPVAGHFVCACRAAMVEIQQYLLAVFDYGMVFVAGDIYNCTDTAGIMFLPNLVKALVF
jgi:hypothetical protein